MLCIREGGVLLRDMVPSDIDDYLRWETVETEWQLWDAPWDYEDRSDAEQRAELARYREVLERRLAHDAALADDEPRERFEICLDDAEDPALATHVGGLGSYLLDDAFCIDESGAHRAIGVDLCDQRARGRGHGKTATRLFIGYFREQGLDELYCQTWSGNERMIGLARGLGFEECCRKPGIRRVRGGVYDGLTFRLRL